MEKLKLNLQHFAEKDTGVSGIAIGVTNFYWAPIVKDTSENWEVKPGSRTRFLKEIEVDRPQEVEEEYGDNMVAATAVYQLKQLSFPSLQIKKLSYPVLKKVTEDINTERMIFHQM